jgi:hypothetical protein
LLPTSPSNEERFQWLAMSMRKYGGEASVVRVKSIDNISTPQLIGRFSEARTRDYQELLRDLQTFSSLAPQKRGAGRLSRLKTRFQEIVDVDFFSSALQKRVAKLLELADQARTSGPPVPTRKIRVARPRPGVDRCASAWLIRNFIDPKARFSFASEDQVPPASVPFDMFHEDGFGHRGNDCTFETLEKQFHICNPRVAAIGQIIHDADLLDDKFGRKEGYGVDEILRGWARQGLADSKLLARGMQLVEGLYYALAK